jgi:hypothetical protein
MAKFQSGHSGRPAGARDTRARLTKQMFEDMLEHWNEPVKPDSTRRKGPAALEVCFKQAPDAYLRLIASVMPRNSSSKTSWRSSMTGRSMSFCCGCVNV